ncbi:hypothetical protein HPB50_026806 [Hyalomma asiaticum]|uniref:Uncharacterized protein n=1 Tax=Hyalomma asiaticum TaxID=266040 RepID=A0ACB7S5Y9_HYAAI|nr:hypothetical protein HPB50_026806 [Hyalomma asiaticum]
MAEKEKKWKMCASGNVRGPMGTRQIRIIIIIRDRVASRGGIDVSQWKKGQLEASRSWGQGPAEASQQPTWWTCPGRYRSDLYAVRTPSEATPTWCSQRWLHKGAAGELQQRFVDGAPGARTHRRPRVRAIDAPIDAVPVDGAATTTLSDATPCTRRDRSASEAHVDFKDIRSHGL